MSLSGSAAEDFQKTGDAALHYDDVQGPGKTRENPGGVFPQVSSTPAQAGTMPGSGEADHGGDVRGVFGNPQMFNDTFSNLSSAFSTAIHSIQDESSSGVGNVGKSLIQRLEAMRAEIDGWRQGKGLPEVEAQGGEGNVEMKDEGGLYKE